MNYYNEHDSKAAAWIRELIKADHIPAGEVDERSICDVPPDELLGFTQCHFFAGIAGWSYALRLAGWPADKPIWTGSCPCQPFSAAGLGLGTEDPRHLWPVFARLIEACEPPIVVGEQVASAAGRLWLAGVFADLEGMGYQRAGADLCAAGVGAPHIRQRLFWLGHTYGAGSQPGRQAAAPNEYRCSAEPDGGARGLADTADNGRPKHERESRQRGNKGPHHSTECASSGRLADANNPERRPDMAGGHDRDGAQAGRQQGDGESGERGASQRVDHCECVRRAEGRNDNGLDERLEPSANGGVDGVGNTGGERFQERISGPGIRHEEMVAQPRQAALGRGNAWDRYDTIPCRDGKARRVESGTFPLAHGVSGRVGLLRGYGNAIVPQVAAEFIGAVMEIL